MRQQLVTRLALDSAGTDSEVSQPVAMEGYNAVSWEATMYALTATPNGVDFQLQISNDMENWTNKGTAQPQAAIGFKQFNAETGITAAYVRLKFTIQSAGKAVFAAGIALTAQ